MLLATKSTPVNAVPSAVNAANVIVGRVSQHAGLAVRSTKVNAISATHAEGTIPPAVLYLASTAASYTQPMFDAVTDVTSAMRKAASVIAKDAR